MDLRKLKTILDLFESSSVSELEITEGEDKVRLSRTMSPMPISSSPPTPAESSALPSANLEEEKEAEAAAGHVVRAPMVGTFYRAPATDKPPFIRAGQRVESGQTLCIVEAMKLMNEIKSPVGGTVAQVLVENGAPVSYGDALFVIE